MSPDDVELLRQVATHISDTLYYAGGAIQKAYTRHEKLIRHDDYDLLRDLAKRMEIEILEARLAELREP